MKLLLIPLLLVGAGAGWLGLSPAATEDCPTPCATEECRVTVECTPQGTCLVTCYDASDEVVCQREVPCDGPCEENCDRPCEKMTEGACEKPCEAAQAATAPPARPAGCSMPCTR